MTKWKLVPCEPTPEMAAVFIPESCKTGSWIDGYKAMLNAAPAPDVQPIAYLYHDARIPEEAHPWLHSTMLVLAPDRRPERCGETPLYLHPPAADMQELVEALQRIVNEVPAGDGCGGFFIEHCDQDGNYIGTESVNPFDVALSLHSIAQEALAKWEKK